ncbi:hypothetical protein O1611_g3732 [Lasiodiplodia mahajangana]|uniref:Uncharacterized protein n=1 Tax=Lasiodiplodia mahajangana TaxID=1108764 RepID=A0ACC2JRL5_9PEZI|nr:hypothetical protein O1611_g3732 [Lasiodiplodia mahajangana]
MSSVRSSVCRCGQRDTTQLSLKPLLTGRNATFPVEWEVTMWWDTSLIETTVTRQFVCSHLIPEEVERLDQPLGFGDGLTDGTYWEWIEKAKRIFLILADLGIPDQIFGIIDDSWDDNDLPIALRPDLPEHEGAGAVCDGGGRPRRPHSQHVLSLRKSYQGRCLRGSYGPDTLSYFVVHESKNEIRLLELHSGNFDDDINCSIRHITLVSTLDFTALSYTWGDPKIRKPISVDSQTLGVTVNLFDALRHLRSSRETRTLWVDAVCINQDDLEERSKQVLRMRDIYTFAKTVEVWLGLADDSDYAAMALVRNLGAVVSDPEESLAKGFYNEYQQAFLDIFEGAQPRDVRALSQLFKRPWWTRVWVVQELTLADQQAAIVRCGEVAVPWLSFLTTAYAIESGWFIVDAIVTGISPEDSVDSFNNGIRMAQCRRENPANPPFSLLELLCQHRDCESTDPRDKVYGLLGLSGDVGGIGIIPNYNQSPEEIFTDLFKKHVLTTESLDMICAVRFPRNFDNLPSWVPDWSVDQTVPGICINDRYIGGNDFAGSPIAHFQKYAASGESLPQVSFSGTQMSVAGICFSRMASLGCVDEGMCFDDVETFGREDEMGKSASDSDTFNEWLNMVLDSPIWDSIAGRYGTENVLDAFCRTLVGNRNNRMTRPPERAGTDSEVQSDDSEDETPSKQGDTPNRSGDTMEPEEGEDDMSTSSQDTVSFSPHEMLSMTIEGFRSCIQVAWGKRFAIFDGGHIGIVPNQARVGDIVAILLGCTMPLVLRRNQGSVYSVIGECYIHGAMDGEVLQESSILFTRGILRRQTEPQAAKTL